MGLFLVYILKSAICLVFFFLFNKLFLSRDTFHGVNRIVWLVVVAVSLVLPLVDWSLYYGVDYSHLAPAVSNALISVVNIPLVVPLPEDGIDMFLVVKYLLVVYFVFVAIFATKLVRSYISLLTFIIPRRVGQESMTDDTIYIDLLESCKSKLGLNRNVHLILHDSDISPFSWMNNIVISRDDVKEDGREILIHELAHIKHGHSWDILLIDLLIIFQWFNPFVWWYKRSILEIHEYMADKSVLDTGINTKQYQLLLIKKTADKCSCYSMTNSLNHSKLKKRIIMMLKQKSNRWAVAKCLYIIPLACLSATLFANPRVSDHFSEISSITAPDESSAVDILSEKVDSEVVVVSKSIPKTLMIDSPVMQDDSIDVVPNFFVTGISLTGASKSDNPPLVIIDGIEASHALLNAISPDAIESVSVLKDKSSRQIYGDKGKNGVILITLKSTTKSDLDVCIVKNSGEKIDKDKVVVVGYGTKAKEGINVRSSISIKAEPLTLIDGKEGNISTVSPDDIDSITVLKDTESIKQYGDKGENGVILVTLKTSTKGSESVKSSEVVVVGYGAKATPSNEDNTRSTQVTSMRFSSKDAPLLLIDGKECSDLDSVSPEDIASISVLKDAKSIKKYGEKAKHGVVIVTLKDSAKDSSKVSLNVSGGTSSSSMQITSGAGEKRSLQEEVRAMFANFPNAVLDSRSKNNPLFIIDGKKSSFSDYSAIASEDIESLIVKDDVKTYGKKAKYGVVIITLKKS